MMNYAYYFYLLLVVFSILLFACDNHANAPLMLNTAQKNLLRGTVKDALSQAPIAGLSIEVKQNNTLLASGLTDASGNFELEVATTKDVKVYFRRIGYREAIYTQITFQKGETTQLDALLVDDKATGKGNISGTFIDVNTGAAVANLSLRLRAANSHTNCGSIVAESSTTKQGTYSFAGIPVGNYIIEAVGSGYYGTSLNVVSLNSTTAQSQNAMIASVKDTSKAKLVLQH